MNCKAVQANLSAYIDRELGGREMLAIRDHLGECAVCRREESEVRQLKALLGSWKSREPSVFLEERLLDAVRRDAMPSRAPAYRRLPWAFAMVAGVAMVATLVALRVSRTPTSAPQDITFEVQRDQIYSAANDPTTGGYLVPTANYGQR